MNRNAPGETTRVFSFIMRCLRGLGLHPNEHSSYLYAFNSILFNFTFTIFYPASMLVDPLSAKDAKVLFANLSTSITSAMAGIKMLTMFFKRRQLDNICRLMREMDERVKAVADPSELDHINAVAKLTTRIFGSYAILFASVGAICLMSVVFGKNSLCQVVCCQLEWFPESWHVSAANFYGLCVYQLIGVWILIFGNLLSDMFPGLCLLIMSAHCRALNIRVSRIGHVTQGKNSKYNRRELVSCIGDHKRILECREGFESAFGGVIFLQVFITQVILCVIAVCFRYNHNKTEAMYTVIYFICMLSEISLPCYAGDKLVHESQQLLDALYSCNWMDQDTEFKRTLIIIMQRTQRPAQIYAGGIVKVSLSTLFTVLKSTYSLFAIADQMR